MTRQHIIRRYRAAFLALAVMLGTGIAGCAPAIDMGREAEREDSRTCERFGAGYGRDYTRCMLEQQRRRDNSLRDNAEAARNNAEAARNNVETVRRMRCNREAERARDRGDRPQPCW